MKITPEITEKFFLHVLHQNGPMKKIDLFFAAKDYASQPYLDRCFTSLKQKGTIKRSHIQGQFAGQDMISLTGIHDLFMTEPVKLLPPVPPQQIYTYVDAVLMIVNNNVSMSVQGESTPCTIEDGKIMSSNVAVNVNTVFVLTQHYPHTRDEAIAAWLDGSGIENPSSTKIHRTSDNDVSWLKFAKWKIHP